MRISGAVLTLVSVAMAWASPLTAAAQDLVIDDFEYPSVEAAREAWVPDEDSEPAGLFERDGGTALRMNADFTDGGSNRAVYDRDVELDLSRWGRFTFDMYIDRPGLFGSFTIYFRSGGGWYGAGTGIGRAGWNRIEVSRADFGTEGAPAGWDQIDGIRLSGWRGSEDAGFMAIDNLMAHREPYAIVMGTHTIAAQGGEARTVQSIAATVAELLDEAGLKTSTIGDEDVEQGALADYEFAIFPYNPDMSEEEIAAIGEYVEAGGHVMTFYQLPESLGDILGIRGVGWQHAEEGQLSEIRFVEDLEDFEGMPRSVPQNSWNLTVAEPTEDAGVIAWWHDSAGENTGLPAFIASDAGVWMSHVLTNTNPSAKRQMLVSILGHYVPAVWPQVAQKAIAGPEQMGHIRGVNNALAWIERNAGNAPDPDMVAEATSDYREMLDDAGEALEAGQFAQATDTAADAWDRLRDAYLLAQVPRDAEFRAWWNHSGTGAFDTWEESMQHLAEHGFNAVVPNMLWGGVALYDSEYLPHHPVVAERGDQIAECVEAAKRHDIEVHVWKVNWNLGGRAPEEFVQQLREEGRLQAGLRGEELEWLCPSDPRNLELELNTMVEVARNYDVDGVHFDYIRYPGQTGCYCEGCHERFERDTGLTVENWPEDLRTDEFADAWTQWRCDNISRLVEATAREVRAIKPDCKISAAVFGSYPGTRESIGQDWGYWIEQGWLDFVCPMDYMTSDTSFATIVARQMGIVGGRIPLYPGIGAWRLGTADRVAGQIQIARGVGADGFILFNYSADLAQNIAPGLGKALLAEDAIHPHNGPAFRFDFEGDLTQERTFGLHIEPGDGVRATVTRSEDVAGREYTQIEALVVLQDETGRTLMELGAFPGDGTRVEVGLNPPNGLTRLAVVGEYEDADGNMRPFVSRSLPIVAGDITDSVAALL
ncbi:MAG: family 10 glycosylhydrolase [Armatimonadota bacterium]